VGAAVGGCSVAVAGAVVGITGAVVGVEAGPHAAMIIAAKNKAINTCEIRLLFISKILNNNKGLIEHHRHGKHGFR
jgi:hypothetical protein